MAAEGLFVTRVIYLEDPTNPVVIQDQANRQRFFDVRFNEDPLRVADQLGRPMAILRLGSKQPRMDRQTGRFMFSSPPARRLLPNHRRRFHMNGWNEPLSVLLYRTIEIRSMSSSTIPTNRYYLPAWFLILCVMTACTTPREQRINSQYIANGKAAGHPALVSVGDGPAPDTHAVQQAVQLASHTTQPANIALAQNTGPAAIPPQAYTGPNAGLPYLPHGLLRGFNSLTRKMSTSIREAMLINSPMSLRTSASTIWMKKTPLLITIR